MQGLLVSIMVPVFILTSCCNPPLPIKDVCPSICSCNKTSSTMSCDGEGHEKHIPTPPASITRLKLNNFNFGELTINTTMPIESCKLKDIEITNCTVSNISVDFFTRLKHLRFLTFNVDFFPMKDYLLAQQMIASPLQRLYIQARTVDVREIHAKDFLHLVHLAKLTLELTQVEHFNTSGISGLTKLSKLGLADNRFQHFHLHEVVPNLRFLDLSQNDFVSVPDLCSTNDEPIAPKLVRFNMEDNAIRILNTSGLSCLDNLKEFLVSQNRIEILYDNTFSNMRRLTELHLSFITNLHVIQDLAFNSTSLRKIHLVRNAKLTNKSFNPKEIFRYTPNLESLDTANTKLDLTTDQLRDLLLTLRNIRHLRMPSSIASLPNNTFCHLHKLEKLVLSGNGLSGWSQDVFANVTSVKQVYLDDNRIKTINESSFPVEFRLSVQHINLANNPFACTCDLMWFVNWTKEVTRNKSISFYQYPERYTCRTPTVKPLTQYNLTPKSCQPKEVYFVILVIVLSVCILFTVCSLVTYRYRWYMLYAISLWRRRPHRPSRTSCRFDAFVSYSNPDEDWVYSEVLNFLEQEHGFRLCQHGRDFQGGKFIIDNVIDSIDDSSKTILVISNSYMQSNWCQFELKYALTLCLQNEIDIVVILLEEISSRYVTSSLRALMNTVTYISWSEEDRSIFRQRLKNDLPIARSS